MTKVSAEVIIEDLDPLEESITDYGLTVQYSEVDGNTTSVYITEDLNGSQITAVQGLMSDQYLLNAISDKVQELDLKLYEIEHNNFTILCEDTQYHEVATDEESVRNLNQESLSALYDPDYSTSYTAVDGYNLASSLTEIITLQAQVARHFKVAKTNYLVVKTAIESVSTLIELDAIDIDAGWTTQYTTWTNAKYVNTTVVSTHDIVNVDDLTEKEMALEVSTQFLVFKHEGKLHKYDTRLTSGYPTILKFNNTYNSALYLST